MKMSSKDAATKRAVMERDNGQCRNCGTFQSPTVSHFISRKVEAYRHDLRNVCVLCMSCHRKAEDRMPGFERWLVSAFPLVMEEFIGAGGESQFKLEEGS